MGSQHSMRQSSKILIESQHTPSVIVPPPFVETTKVDESYHRDISLFDLEKAINEISELNSGIIPESKLDEVKQERPTEVFRAASLTKSLMSYNKDSAFITEMPIPAPPKEPIDPDSYSGTVETLINAQVDSEHYNMT